MLFLSSNCFSDIVVATTIEEEDDVLVDYLSKEGINYFRGSKIMFILDFLNYLN